MGPFTESPVCPLPNLGMEQLNPRPFTTPEPRLHGVPIASHPFRGNLNVLCSRRSCAIVALSVSHFVYLTSEGSALTNGALSLHSPVKRKLEAEKDYVFDKRLRYSVRQNENNCRFRDIVVRKEEGFTHILLSSQTSDNNALTPEVRGQHQREGQAGKASPSVRAGRCFLSVPSMQIANTHTNLATGHNLLIT